MAETKRDYYGAPVPENCGPAHPPPYGPPPGAYPYPPGPQNQGPPHAAYPQQPGPQGPTVMHTTAVAPPPAVLVMQLGPQSTRTTCRSCHHEISTRIESDASSKTHLIALVLFLLGCWCCCCIPYCVDSCMNTNHYCPNCNAFLGSYTS